MSYNSIIFALVNSLLVSARYSNISIYDSMVISLNPLAALHNLINLFYAILLITIPWYGSGLTKQTWVVITDSEVTLVLYHKQSWALCAILSEGNPSKYPYSNLHFTTDV